MKRKVMVGLTVVALMGVTALPVSAQDNTESKDTTITANIQSTYTLTIPSETQIAFESPSTDLNGKLKVAGNVRNGEEVIVTVSKTAFHNEEQGTDLPYMLVNKEDGKVFTDMTWDEDTLRAGLTGTGKEVQLSVNIKETDWKTAEAGEYEGTITFTADLQEQP